MAPDTQQPDEPKDYEFGSYCFKELEPAKVLETLSKEVIEIQAATCEGIECLIHLHEWPEVDGIVFSFKEKPLKEQTLYERSKCREHS